MVHLRQHRHAAVVESVDDVHLPERAGPVELAADDSRHLLGELTLIARCGQRLLADVVLDVERAVVDPVRVVQRERHLGEAPAEGGQQVQTFADQPTNQCGIKGFTRCGLGVIDAEDADVALDPVVLHGQELCVEAGQLSHAKIVRRWGRHSLVCVRQRCAGWLFNLRTAGRGGRYRALHGAGLGGREG